MSKIFVSGGNGFVGVNLVKRLIDDGNEVTVLMNKNEQANSNNACEYFYFDKYEEIVEKFVKEKYDYCIHLASVYLNKHDTKDINVLIDSNVKLGTYLLEGMVKSGCKYLINTSTSFQHYNNSLNYNPVNLYAATKECFEKIIEYYANAFDIKCISLVLFDTYGLVDTRRKLISILADCAKSNQELKMSPGDQELSLSFVSDIVDAFCLAMEIVKEENKPTQYAVRGQEIFTLKELVNKFERITGKKMNVIFGALPYRDREVMNIWKNLEILPGYTPKVDIDKGIELIWKNINH